LSSPPPIPPRPIVLDVTEKMLRDAMRAGGLTASISNDLNAVCTALRNLHAQTPKQRSHAIALTAAFQVWRRGNHPGELSILQKTPEFQSLAAFAAKFPAAGALPPLPLNQASLPSTLKSIGVALYSTQNQNLNFASSLNARMNNIRYSLLLFSNWLVSVNPNLRQLDNPFQGIFVAPEYYFTRPNPAGQRQFLSLAEKNQIEVGLKQISASFPNILLIPGTIHYDVEMSAKAKEQAGFQLLLAAKQRILREKQLASPRNVLDAEMHHNKVGPYSAVPSLNVMADHLLDKNTTPRKIHNLTYLLLNGKIWAQYDKHTDFYEAKSISPEQSLFIPGTQEECPEIGNGVREFRFGAEICFDHGNGVLKRRAPANLHFHVVVSDSVPTQKNNMAMCNGGYFLHASTDYAETVVYRRNDNGTLVNLTATTAKQKLHASPHILDAYLLRLPNPLPPST
jgi:hypothetical protein